MKKIIGNVFMLMLAVSLMSCKTEEKMNPRDEKATLKNNYDEILEMSVNDLIENKNANYNYYVDEFRNARITITGTVKDIWNRSYDKEPGTDYITTIELEQGWLIEIYTHMSFGKEQHEEIKNINIGDKIRVKSRISGQTFDDKIVIRNVDTGCGNIDDSIIEFSEK